MQSYHKRRLIAAACLVVTIAIPSIRIARQYRQNKLDRALLVAIKQKNVRDVDALLAAGANPSARDTPTPKAKPLLVTLKELFHQPKQAQFPTALNTALEQTQTSLFVPNYTETPHIVRALIAAGADVNTKDNFGKTPVSIVKGLDILRLLKAAGAKQ